MDQSEKPNPDAEFSRNILVAVGANLGRTTRMLGKGSDLLFKRSGSAIASAARNLGAGVKTLKLKRDERAALAKPRAQAEKLGREKEVLFRDIGSEVARNATAGSSSVEISDKIRELIARVKNIDDELERIEKALRNKPEAREPGEMAKPEDAKAKDAPDQSAEAKSAEAGKKDRGGRKTKAEAEPHAAPPDESGDKAADKKPDEPRSEREPEE